MMYVCEVRHDGDVRVWSAFNADQYCSVAAFSDASIAAGFNGPASVSCHKNAGKKHNAAYHLFCSQAEAEKALAGGKLPPAVSIKLRELVERHNVVRARPTSQSLGVF